MTPDSNTNQEEYHDYVDCATFLKNKRLKELTEEELGEVRRAFHEFEEYRYHPDIGDSLLSAVAAAALCNYSLRLIRDALDPDLETNETRVGLGDEAISATRKAIDLYPHPVLFGRLAIFLEATGWHDDAKKIRSIQEKQLSAWVPRRADEFLMIRLDSDMWLERT